MVVGCSRDGQKRQVLCDRAVCEAPRGAATARLQLTWLQPSRLSRRSLFARQVTQTVTEAVDDLRALELRMERRSRVVAAGTTVVPAEESMAISGIKPRGHGLVGAWIRCKGMTHARCVEFDAISGMCTLEAGETLRKERLHGPGSLKFEVLSLPPPFCVEAIACVLCGDPPACKTECCGSYLCSACLESRERARAEFMVSTALVRPSNPNACYFCRSGSEARVPVAGFE